MHVKIKKLVPEAIVPKYATDGSGAFDLFATSVEKIHDNVYRVGTGLSFEIPKGYGLFILSRSGQGFNFNTRLSNCVGLIDSDYRGEVKVQLHSDIVLTEDTDFDKLTYNVGDRIAQGLLLQIPKVSFLQVEQLSETKRATDGFGSTGK